MVPDVSVKLKSQTVHSHIFDNNYIFLYILTVSKSGPALYVLICVEAQKIFLAIASDYKL